MKKILLLLPLWMLLSKSNANVRLPAVLASNMVLEQNSLVSMWGWCDAGEKIYITNNWDNKTDSTIGTRDAKWTLKIKTPAAGGPFTITIKGNNTIILNNVMVGEVWVCSGQSNMEFNSHYAGSKDIEPEIHNPVNNNIHILNIPHTTSMYPQEDCYANWQAADSSSLKTVSEVAYFFAKKINKQLNVPIGIIEAAWGGTPAEVWTPADVVNTNDTLKESAHKQNETPWWPYWPGYLFNGMIFPVTSYTVAGAIWYQGEGNTVAPSTYGALFSSMIKAWRRAWNINLPFYFVQIAPFTYGNNYSGSIIREQQAKVLALDNTGMVVASDITADTTNIHPPDKLDVGERLANIALADVYHQNVKSYKSPVYKSMSVNNNKATIDFYDVEKGLMIKGDRITQLYIAGKDSIFYAADAKTENNKLIVSSKNVEAPIAVRYEFSNAAVGNLFSTEGLPVAPFRTDDWNLEEKKK